jgi:hypothetical protein
VELPLIEPLLDAPPEVELPELVVAESGFEVPPQAAANNTNAAPSNAKSM